MKKLEIKKIDTKLDLDTKTEGCWNDCYSKTVWESYSADLVNDYPCCKKVKKYNAKKCWFW